MLGNCANNNNLVFIFNTTLQPTLANGHIPVLKFVYNVIPSSDFPGYQHNKFQMLLMHVGRRASLSV